MRLTVGDRIRLELELPGLVVAVALLLAVVFGRRGLDDLLRASARRIAG